MKEHRRPRIPAIFLSQLLLQLKKIAVLRSEMGLLSSPVTCSSNSFASSCLHPDQRSMRSEHEDHLRLDIRLKKNRIFSVNSERAKYPFLVILSSPTPARNQIQQKQIWLSLTIYFHLLRYFHRSCSLNNFPPVNLASAMNSNPLANRDFLPLSGIQTISNLWQRDHRRTRIASEYFWKIP